MGAWGTGILQDDLVLDIAEDYKTLMSYGIEPPVALNKVRDHYSSDISEDEENLFWIAIASVNWRYGITGDAVTQTALEMIDNEKYMQIWKEQGDKAYFARKKAIEKFRNDLLYVQRPPKKIPKPVKDLRRKTAFQKGDLITYQLGSTVDPDKAKNIFGESMILYRKWIILRVIEIGMKPVSRIMPELDHHSFASAALYNGLFSSKPTCLPDDAQLIEIFSKNLAGDFIPYHVMQIDEAPDPFNPLPPEVSVIGRLSQEPDWGNNGFNASYREIDNTAIYTYHLKKTLFCSHDD